MFDWTMLSDKSKAEINKKILDSIKNDKELNDSEKQEIIDEVLKMNDSEKQGYIDTHLDQVEHAKYNKEYSILNMNQPPNYGGKKKRRITKKRKLNRKRRMTRRKRR